VSVRTLAHLSDLHLGESPARERRAEALVRAVLEAQVDHVVLTGDVTHSGRLAEYRRFEALFRPLRERELLTVVPGNHDCGGENVAELLSDELRVAVDAREGLFMVCINSTAPHNVRSWRAHGELGQQTLEAVDAALDLAAPGRLRCVLLHHHLLPLPVEGVGEWFAHQLGWPHAGELPLGRELLRRVQGRCDVVLHGHRHVPRHFSLEGPVPLQVLNAGSTTELGAFRVLSHRDGRLEAIRWVTVEPRVSSRALELPAAQLQLG
jgi:3',5'-cyclic AMP phosphodiesterase CpdA